MGGLPALQILSHAQHVLRWDLQDYVPGCSIDHPDHHLVRVQILLESRAVVLAEHFRSIQSSYRLNDIPILLRLLHRNLGYRPNGSRHAAVHCGDIHNASLHDSLSVRGWKSISELDGGITRLTASQALP